MAKKSSVEKNKRRMKTVAKYAKLRQELKMTIQSSHANSDDKEAAWIKLRSLPRNANPNRVRLRCQFTGRSRGNYRKFGICRIMLRELALNGEIPGMQKASW